MLIICHCHWNIMKSQLFVKQTDALVLGKIPWRQEDLKSRQYTEWKQVQSPQYLLKEPAPAAHPATKTLLSKPNTATQPCYTTSSIRVGLLNLRPKIKNIIMIWDWRLQNRTKDSGSHFHEYHAITLLGRQFLVQGKETETE